MKFYVRPSNTPLFGGLSIYLAVGSVHDCDTFKEARSKVYTRTLMKVTIHEERIDITELPLGTASNGILY